MKWLYIAGGILGITIGFIIYKRMKSNKSIDKKRDFKEGNTITKEGDLIISVPVTKADKYPINYVFGGIDYANPDWMLKQTPQYILSRSIVVFAPYTKSFDSINVDSFLKKNNLQIDSNKRSISGFSAGGLNVQRKFNKDFRTIGLIDPSTKADFLELPFNKNTIMTYNERNWGGNLTYIRELLPKLAKKVSDKSGIGERVDIKHADIPKYFFEKYKDKFI